MRAWHAPRNSQVSKISKCQWISEPTSKKELWRTRPFSDLRTTTWSWRRSRGPCSGESLRWGWWWSPSPSWRGSCPAIGSSQPETGDNLSSCCWFFIFLTFISRVCIHVRLLLPLSIVSKVLCFISVTILNRENISLLTVHLRPGAWDKYLHEILFSEIPSLSRNFYSKYLLENWRKR